jgi:hypothetical protein
MRIHRQGTMDRNRNHNQKYFTLTLLGVIAAISIMNLRMSSRAGVVTPSVALGQGESLDEALISENNRDAMIRTSTTTAASTMEYIGTTVRHASIPETRNDTTEELNANYSLAELSSNAILFDSLFNNSLAPQTSTIPWPNVTTTAFSVRVLYSGYRNQMMCVTLLILGAIKSGHGQYLVESIAQKDLHGSNKFVPFEELWDLEHWNSFYPELPRFVHSHPIIHDQWNPSTKHWLTRADLSGITSYRNADDSLITHEQPVHPYGFLGKQSHLMLGYMRYAKGRGPYTQNGHRHPAEILMLQGALRPTPYLRGIIQKELHALEGTVVSETAEYITLHARVVRIF